MSKRPRPRPEAVCRRFASFAGDRLRALARVAQFRNNPAPSPALPGLLRLSSRPPPPPPPPPPSLPRAPRSPHGAPRRPADGPAGGERAPPSPPCFEAPALLPPSHRPIGHPGHGRADTTSPPPTGIGAGAPSFGGHSLYFVLLLFLASPQPSIHPSIQLWAFF